MHGPVEILGNITNLGLVAMLHEIAALKAAVASIPPRVLTIEVASGDLGAIANAEFVRGVQTLNIVLTDQNGNYTIEEQVTVPEHSRLNVAAKNYTHTYIRNTGTDASAGELPNGLGNCCIVNIGGGGGGSALLADGAARAIPPVRWSAFSRNQLLIGAYSYSFFLIRTPGDTAHGNPTYRRRRPSGRCRPLPNHHSPQRPLIHYARRCQ
jgi:hypothetical protein